MPRVSEIAMLKQVEQPILYIESHTDMEGLGKVIGDGFAKISAYLEELGEMTIDVPFLYYEGYDTFSDDNIHATVGFPVPRSLPEKGEIKSKTLPERKVIFCFYRGDYEQMAPVYGEMEKWLRDNGYEVTSSSYEQYYNGPDYPQEEMLTKIIMPIK